jgi:hypothetical protein
MTWAFVLALPLAASTFVFLAPACSSSSGAAAASDSGADQSAADTGPVETGSPDGESNDTGSAADSAPAADTGTVADGSSIDAGGDGSLAACQQTCEATNMAGFDKFVGDALSVCACAAGSPCNADCTAECADASTLMMGSTCATCLRTQIGTSPHPVCVTTAGTLCFGDSTCDSFLSCVQGC